jgi:hypothetical protein
VRGLAKEPVGKALVMMERGRNNTMKMTRINRGRDGTLSYNTVVIETMATCPSPQYTRTVGIRAY